MANQTLKSSIRLVATNKFGFWYQIKKTIENTTKAKKQAAHWLQDWEVSGSIPTGSKSEFCVFQPANACGKHAVAGQNTQQMNKTKIIWYVNMNTSGNK